MLCESSSTSCMTMQMTRSTVIVLLYLFATSSSTLTRSVFLSLLTNLQQDKEEPRDEEVVLQEYDFIVVGAGTAGCAIASRLTEVDDWNVLLLEAGGEEHFLMDIPALASSLQFSPANWEYKTVPSNSACLGLKNRQNDYPRGKVMGGSSVLNFLIYTRGNRRDYDHWEALGNTGWGYKSILEYFKKTEDMTIPELAKDTRYHGKGGYVPVSYTPYHTQLAEAFLQAGVETGQPIVDYNAATQTGFSYLQTTAKKGLRWSASRAFLHPVHDRKNLHVKKRSLVTRILFDETRRAIGVEFKRWRKKYVVRARKEVIVSGGAINSPQLLMLSGLGPREHLDEMNIPVVQDLSVGFNLQDHVTLGGLTFLVNQSVSLITDDVLIEQKAIVDYLAYQRGPLSVPGGYEALAFYDLQNPNAADGYPDLELVLAGGSLASGQGSGERLKELTGIDEDIYYEVYEPILGLQSFTVSPVLLRPKSRGRITLKDKNPYTHPLINQNFFDDPADLATVVAGAQKMVELSRTKAFQKYGTKLHDIPIPACARYKFASDEYFSCMARQLTFTAHHMSGTCKMGPAADRDAVVDPRLRVYGVRGLRVIDASIMPVIPAAHINAAVYMIAEKGADMIKQDWSRYQ